jgi:hypothetical protein
VIYPYHCPVCGDFERDVPVADRDIVICSCGRTPTRLLARSMIMIPLAFAISRNFGGEPRNADERATWDRDGVRPLRKSDY